MHNAKKRLLASAAILACLAAAPSMAETTTTTTSQTVTETPAGAAVVERTVTETTPDSTATHTTTVTTEQPATTRTEVHWETVERTVPTGTRVLSFPDFDVNKDAVLSLPEIGQMLFKLYDTDGNEVIDNIEYERKAVVTVMPMEKTTTISYDFDGDGLADKTQHTHETFMRDTLLTRFDANKDGLSPHEFANMSFIEADINDDKAIELKEWQGLYNATIDKQNKEKARFNNKK